MRPSPSGILQQPPVQGEVTRRAVADKVPVLSEPSGGCFANRSLARSCPIESTSELCVHRVTPREFLSRVRCGMMRD